MGESTMATFLTGKRKRWLCVTWGLFLVGVLALPDVDHSRRQYRELGELRVKLASRDELPDRARTLAERVAQMETAMADLETALVSPDVLSAFRQDVTRMARGAGCRLRSIRPGPEIRRALDEVLGTTDNKANSATKNTEWEVEEQVSSISVQGAFGSLLEFLSALENEARILQLASLHLHSPPDKGGELVLELQVKTFNLLRAGPG